MSTERKVVQLTVEPCGDPVTGWCHTCMLPSRLMLVALVGTQRRITVLHHCEQCNDGGFAV